jgi:nucleotidyltransferase substrate binding protein (TIGR01987 family)
MTHDVRWKQRFENLDRAVALLREPFEGGIEGLSPLEKEGAVHRFEFVLELAWKTLKDFLESEGWIIEPVTPRNVVREAFSARIVTDGQVWIDMIDHRNLLSHTYDRATFEAAVREIRDRYLPAVEELRQWFAGRSGP